MKILNWLIRTWLGRAALSAIIMVVFGLIYTYGYQDWAMYPVYAAVSYMVIFFLYMFYWATRNTISDIKDWWRRKNK